MMWEYLRVTHELEASDVHEPAAASAAENEVNRTNTGNKRKVD